MFCMKVVRKTEWSFLWNKALLTAFQQQEPILALPLILVLFYARPTSLTGMMEVVWIRQFFLLQNLMKKEM